MGANAASAAFLQSEALTLKRVVHLTYAVRIQGVTRAVPVAVTRLADRGYRYPRSALRVS